MQSSRFQISPPLSAQVRRRRELVGRALRLADRLGYEEIEIPLLAPWEELREASGDDVSAHLFRFVDRDGSLLVLRGDLTPIVARQAAALAMSRQLPLRISYAGRTARVQRAFAREQIESYELGCELIGPSAGTSDVEILALAIEVLSAIGVPTPELRVGDVRLSAGVVDSVTADAALRHRLHEAIGRADRHELRTLLRDACTDSDTIAAAELLCAPPAGREGLAALAAFRAPTVQRACAELLALLSQLDDAGYGDAIGVDLRARDDRGYYTGMRFSLVAGDPGVSIGSGGRYDRLLSHFGADVPAVGFGLRLDRILGVLAAAGPVPEPVPSLVVDVHPRGVANAFAAARAAHARGERVRLRHLPHDPTEGGA